jgi:nitroreductase
MGPSPSPPDPDGPEGLAEPLRSRWSPSVFDAVHLLSRAQVETLLTAARWAPSSGNSQPWRFVVAPRGSAAHAALVPHLSRGNAGWVPRASLVLVAGCEVVDVKDPDTARYDLGQAVAHLTLQAVAMGLATHQFGGFDKPAAALALGVPDHVQLLAGIAVGVRGDPAEVPERDRERELRERTRRPLAEVAHDVGDGGWRPWGG